MGACALLSTAGAHAGADAEGAQKIAPLQADIIDRTDFRSASGVFDLDALMALGRVSSPTVSPDGKTILFGISYESLEQNKSNNDLYTVNVDGTGLTRITRTARSEGGAVWIDGGRRIAFTYADEGGKTQLWVMNADGSDRRQVSNVDGGIEGFSFAPNGRDLCLIRSIKSAQTAQDVYPDLPQATGRVIDDLMYKHWDEWVERIPHPFLATFDGSTVTVVKDIMDGEPYEAPMRPFGGAESLAWSPDSKSLIYVSRKKTGKDYAVSTNSDLYRYDLATGTTVNLTEGMMGYDQNPAYSPDGRYVAWLSMERDGYEADKQRLFILDTTTGAKTDLTANWDYTIDEFAWRPDGKSIVFIAYHHGGAPVFSIDLKTRTVTTLADGQCDYTSLAVIDNNRLITMQHSMLRPNELYSVVTKGKKSTVTRLTDTNDHIFSQLTMPTVERRMVPTTDGKEMLTWVVYPPKFDASKKYPAILYCQGGPQSAVSQFWSYRWNFALQASNGYIMIAPNRRGVPGFGTEWEEQISKDYTGQNMRDYLSAVDYMVANEPAIDAKHVGCTGASYGGFSTYWLAGNHDGRFAAFFAHAGIFNTEAQYLETEEMWFANWDMGGAYWDKDNAAAQRTYAQSPHRFVDKWDTPIMISHGEYDFRILASQGMMAFNAAKLRGIPTEMVIFPDENHWILKPQNAVQWQRLFFRWFDRWLK
jgi:dipeptidyl aminopeptidase/acylaminoacyl peptidase